jgi:hypothetical protein
VKALMKMRKNFNASQAHATLCGSDIHDTRAPGDASPFVHRESSTCVVR